MTLLEFHQDFAWFVVVTNGLAGLWALGANWLVPLRVRALWIFTAVAQISIFVQVALGVAVLSVDDIEAPPMHTFYGFVALFAAGIVYSYRQQIRQHIYLLYGFGGLFLMGLGIRAMILGPT